MRKMLPESIVHSILATGNVLSAAFLIGASIKSKAVWLYKPVLFLIVIEERSIRQSSILPKLLDLAYQRIAFIRAAPYLRPDRLRSRH